VGVGLSGAGSGKGQKVPASMGGKDWRDAKRSVCTATTARPRKNGFKKRRKGKNQPNAKRGLTRVGVGAARLEYHPREKEREVVNKTRRGEDTSIRFLVELLGGYQGRNLPHPDENVK